jgi:hypothetical protein
MSSLLLPGSTLPLFLGLSYPGKAVNTASYPEWLRELAGSARHLCNRIESAKKAFTFDPGFV